MGSLKNHVCMCKHTRFNTPVIACALDTVHAQVRVVVIVAVSVGVAVIMEVEHISGQAKSNSYCPYYPYYNATTATVLPLLHF